MNYSIGYFYTAVALPVWTNLAKHFLFVWLCARNIKKGRKRIKRLEELSSYYPSQYNFNDVVRKAVCLDVYSVLCSSLYLERITVEL